MPGDLFSSRKRPERRSRPPIFPSRAPWPVMAVPSCAPGLQEAVARTKIVLKLLEAKSDAVAQSLSHGGDGGGGHHSGGAAANASSCSAKVKVKRAAARERDRGRERGRRPSASQSPAAGGRAGSLREERRPNRTASAGGQQQPRVSATAAAAGPNSLPKKDGSTDEGGGTKRSIHKVLRMATEAYSDRVRQQGGGVTRYRPPASSVQGGAGAGGAGAAGPVAVRGAGGDRARMNASARVVQVAFRRRMFHRFVWAQAYLRRPTHAYGILKRVCPPRLGGGAAGGAASGGAAGAGTAGATATPIGSRQTDAQGKGATLAYGGGDGGGAADNVLVIDAWPELPGFCLSVPHHMHAADIAYLEYSRWRRANIVANGDDEGAIVSDEAASTSATAAASRYNNNIISPIQQARDCRAAVAGTTSATTSSGNAAATAPPTATTATVATATAAPAPAAPAAPAAGITVQQLSSTTASPVRFNTDASPPSPSPSPSQPPPPPPPPPPGAQLFERKHAIHAAAVRSVVVDLRVPFGPGALDAAMEDLERAISTGGGGRARGGKRPSRGGGQVAQAQQSSSDRNSRRGAAWAMGGRSPNRSGGYGHHGGGLSFVCWHDWWVRHLPYDPASTDCLLKTVRCAKGLHSAEMAAAAAAAAAATVAAGGGEGGLS